MQPDEYRKLSEVEDRMWYFRALHRRIAHWLERLLPPGPARVLDAGCGTGGLIRSLRAARPEWTATGLDLMPQACQLARERTGAEIVEGSVTALPFAAGSFDAVVSADVIYHVKADGDAVREFARVVRPGGVVLVNVPAYRWLWSYHDIAVESQRRYTRPEVVGLFREVGLGVDFASYANLLPLPLVVARRKLFPPANPTSDVQVFPAPVEATFRALAAMEHAWQRAGWASPAGSSVFVAGRHTGPKPPGSGTIPPGNNGNF